MDDKAEWAVVGVKEEGTGRGGGIGKAGGSKHLLQLFE